MLNECYSPNLASLVIRWDCVLDSLVSSRIVARVSLTVIRQSSNALYGILLYIVSTMLLKPVESPSPLSVAILLGFLSCLSSSRQLYITFAMR